MILGLDPGLGTFGWARLSSVGAVESIGVLELAPSKTKDYEDRSHRQASVLLEQLAGVDLVVAEALSFPRAGRAGAISLCLSWGGINGACVARGIPVVRTRPQQWQHACLGDGQGRGAVDYDTLVADLERYVRRFGTTAAVADLDLIPPSKRGHPLDAVGVALWGLARGSTAPRVGAQPAARRRRARKASR